MKVKFLRGTMRFGYAYRAGDERDISGIVPDELVKEWIASGFAIPVELKKRPAKPKKAKVQTTVIERNKKR